MEREYVLGSCLEPSSWSPLPDPSVHRLVELRHVQEGPLEGIPQGLGRGGLTILSSGRLRPLEYKDPTNHFFGIPRVLGLRTRMEDPHVYMVFEGANIAK